MTPTRQQRRQQGGAGSIPVREIGEHRPCDSMPEFWDAPSTDNPPAAERFRVRAAQDECRQCPHLAACLGFLRSWAHPDGVVAGQVWKDGRRLDVPAGPCGTPHGWTEHRRRKERICDDHPKHAASRGFLVHLFGKMGKEAGPPSLPAPTGSSGP